jgi:hypothetical protein
MPGDGQVLQPGEDSTVWLNIVTPGYFDAVRGFAPRTPQDALSRAASPAARRQAPPHL